MKEIDEIWTEIDAAETVDTNSPTGVFCIQHTTGPRSVSPRNAAVLVATPSMGFGPRSISST